MDAVLFRFFILIALLLQYTSASIDGLRVLAYRGFFIHWSSAKQYGRPVLQYRGKREGPL
jgi:hypothetical protein